MIDSLTNIQDCVHDRLSLTRHIGQTVSITCGSLSHWVHHVRLSLTHGPAGRLRLAGPSPPPCSLVSGVGRTSGTVEWDVRVGRSSGAVE